MIYWIGKTAAVILLLYSLLGFCSQASCATYVTTEGLEPDKVASIWLIKRFVDQEARFKFIGKNESADAGEIPFDMPEAALRRFQARSTFETILARYAIKDTRLLAIGRLIHDMEINTWMKDRLPESVALENQLLEIIRMNTPIEVTIDRALSFWDGYFEQDKLSTTPLQ